MWQGKRVLIYGDSQAEGLGPTLERLLTARGAASVTVVAQTGLPLRGALARLLPPPADIAIVSLGGNNPPSDADTAKRALRTVRDALPAATFWITVVPSLDPEQQVGRARMAGFQKRFLPGMGVRLIDGAVVTRSLPHANDVHLTLPAYREAAFRVGSLIGGLPGSVMAGIGGFVSLAIAVSHRRLRSRNPAR